MGDHGGNPHEAPALRDARQEEAPLIPSVFFPHATQAPSSLARITAPFTPVEVDVLNHLQREGSFHAFTCGGDRGDAAHVRYAREHGDRDEGLLVAGVAGWRCPVCDYRQNWAYGLRG